MDKIIAILKELRPEFDFSTSTDFITDGILDSFDIISLISTLDSTFGISIDGVDIIPENFKDIDTIAALLRKNGVTL